MIPIHKRKIGVCIFLSIITCGIYQLYWEYLLIKNTKALKGDSSSCTKEMLCLVFVPFYYLYWWYTRGQLVKDSFAKDGRSAAGSGTAYLILGLFGLVVISLAIMQHDFNDAPGTEQMVLGRSAMSKALVRRKTISGYLFMLPSLIFFVGFVVYPMVMCIYTSFFDATMDLNRGDIFIGFDNYKELFQDPIFLRALKNTVIIVVVSVPVTCAFSLWVSSAIYKMRGPIRSAFRCIFYLPVVTGSVAVTVVWKWMYNNYYGIFNYLGRAVGLLEGRINWLGDERFALGCIILILLTTSVGQPIVLYVSALGNVDQSLVEASQVDGANNMQVFWRIKWPQIMPTTLYVLVITTINSFQCFALIQLLTSGGPNHSTDTIMYYIYYEAFKLYRYGYGNAMGVILAIIIAIFSAVQFKLAKADTSY